MLATGKAPFILATLWHISKKYGKDYCYPAQLTIQEKMRKYYNYLKSIATLNRHLRVLEDEWYILRRRRIRNDPKLGMIFKSTMYWITLKGYYLLRELGLPVQGMIDRLEQHDGKKRPEKRSEPEKDVRLGEMAPLSDIMGRVLKCPVIAGLRVSPK